KNILCSRPLYCEEKNRASAGNFQRDAVQLVAFFFRSTDLPSGRFRIPSGGFGQFFDKPFHINNRVSLEHLGQAVGQVAGQTFSWSLVQLKSKAKTFVFYAATYQTDIIRTIFRAPVESVEKLVRAFSRKKRVEHVPGKTVRGCGHGISPVHTIFQKLSCHF
ncbi:MAG: hypothetical protein K2O70_11435, partial [Desulfovibrionaceae bacterium]|nr:hypothetical protein [Desulfovibrionaceae bacterium]